MSMAKKMRKQQNVFEQKEPKSEPHEATVVQPINNLGLFVGQSLATLAAVSGASALCTLPFIQKSSSRLHVVAGGDDPIVILKPHLKRDTVMQNEQNSITYKNDVHQAIVELQTLKSKEKKLTEELNEITGEVYVLRKRIEDVEKEMQKSKVESNTAAAAAAAADDDDEDMEYASARMTQSITGDTHADANASRRSAKSETTSSFKDAQSKTKSQ